MRVIFLSYHFSEYCIRLAAALAQDVHLCLVGPRHWDAEIKQWSSKIDFQPFDQPHLRQPIRQLQTNSRLLRLINDFNPDVIHFQHGHFWFNLALPWLKRYPLVMTIHDPRHHPGDRSSQVTPQRLLDFGFRRATQIIVHTNYAAQVVMNELGIPAEKIHVIPHIELGYANAAPHISEEEGLILFFGRIWAYKGLEYLIRAEPLITARAPQAKIVIAGQGENLSQYQRLMTHPDKFIVQNEFIPDEQCAELFRRASVVVLPYIEATQSGVIPIAYTFKKPVVATQVGGLPEQVEHGRTGYLVPPRNAQALAEAIVPLLHNRALRSQLGANGRQKLATEWSAAAIARQTIPVYAQAIASRQISNQPAEVA